MTPWTRWCRVSLSVPPGDSGAGAGSARRLMDEWSWWGQMCGEGRGKGVLTVAEDDVRLRGRAFARAQRVCGQCCEQHEEPRAPRVRAVTEREEGQDARGTTPNEPVEGRRPRLQGAPGPGKSRARHSEPGRVCLRLRHPTEAILPDGAWCYNVSALFARVRNRSSAGQCLWFIPSDLGFRQTFRGSLPRPVLPGYCRSGGRCTKHVSLQAGTTYFLRPKAVQELHIRVFSAMMYADFDRGLR